MRSARFTASGAAWIFVGMVLFQVFLAGVGIFGAGTLDGHRGFGYLIPLAAIIVLLLQAGARVPGTIRLSGLLVLITMLQPMLAYAKQDAPMVAALHPVNALLIGITGFVIARRSLAAARATAPDAQEAPAPETSKA